MLEIRLDQIRTDAASRDAYDVIYDEGDISLRSSFYLWLVKLFALQPDDVYLDISCGRGHLPALAQKQGVQTHGLDLSFAAVRSATGRGHLIVGNSQALPYADDSFTAISNIGSIEHYVDMRAAIREMVRVLKPGGRAFLLVPNTFSLLHNVWIAFRRGRTNIDNQPIQRYLARQEWQQLFEEQGLVADKVAKYEIERPRTRADFFSYLRHPKRMVRLMLTPFVPLNLAFCFVFVCHKPR
ncbi:MAG: class I SAM-dependent methyltransferase [Chloroflexi bacterium]|nr:class I SAM-dependent methyltransferase [Chloroflexota bacterium]MCI0580100.1 class I SAM-dependent methyltransferase [Chloroflexota bacterium]MCI0649324.1 class I SAM-dependent methyltransferase [Chloroflexota bacterium]MCI0725943.1 class I SAM-dependent methyltransferase [Chloroflexota bacterium]